MDSLTISVALLWVAVLIMAFLLWAISRQVGVLFERISPMGALVTDSGPPIGSPSPLFKLTGIQSEVIEIGGEQSLPSLIFFLSPTCPVCKKLLPALKALAHDERQHLSIVLASDGEAAEHLQFVRQHGLSKMPYVLSTQLGMEYRVSRLPYAVLLDKQGTVVSKGLVNSREQLDSLLNAQDMQTPTIQQYLNSSPA